MNKVTEMNCTVLFLFNEGFAFVKKTTGRRTLRAKVPRCICWCHQVWWIWVRVTARTTLSLTLQLPTPQCYCRGLPTFPVPPSAISTCPHLQDTAVPRSPSARAGENLLSLRGVGHLLSHTGTGAGLTPLFRQAPNLSKFAGKSIDVNRGFFFLNPRGQPWAV